MSSSTDPVPVGRLGRPHGLDGFLGLYIDQSDSTLFEIGATVQLDGEPMTVRALRRTDKGFQVAFVEAPDRNSAEELRGRVVAVDTPRDLDEGEYWFDQLIGLSVLPGGGVVVGVEPGPAQDRLVVQRGEIQFEVPFVDALVPKVDLDGGFVEIVEMEGLTPPLPE